MLRMRGSVASEVVSTSLFRTAGRHFVYDTVTLYGRILLKGLVPLNARGWRG